MWGHLGFGTGSPGLTFPDGSTVSITRSSLVGNTALGDTGTTAGDAQGGGIIHGAELGWSRVLYDCPKRATQRLIRRPPDSFRTGARRA